MKDKKQIEARHRIGAELRSLRQEAGMTQTDIANKIGIAMQTICKIEAGKWNFGLDTITAYANVFGKQVQIL